MNFTSIEQSKKLLELGLKPETADMFYPNAPVTVPCVDDGRSKGSIFIPCWSVGALMKLLPVESYKLYRNEFSMYKMSCSVHTNPTGYNNAIDACYEMVVWLLQNNYIKKGE